MMMRRVRVESLLWAACALTCLVAVHPGLCAEKSVAQVKGLVTVLQSDAALEKKAEACRQLAVVGDASAVPVLAGMLADAELAHMARYALEPIPAPAVDAALRSALSKLSGNPLIGAIGSIGVRRDPEAVSVLVPLLKHVDPAVSAAAAAALGQIATQPAVKALADLRKTAAGPLRGAAADASLVAARRLLEQDKHAAAAAIYGELQGKGQPGHIALAVFCGLLEAEPAKAADRVALAIGSNDATVRATAINRIPTIERENFRSDLLANLAKMPAEAQVLVIGVLSKSGDSSLLPAITKAIGSSHPGVRLAVVEALGRIGDANSVPLLSEALTTGDSDAEKRAASASLLSLKGDGVDEAIVRQMNASAVGVRPALIAMLADRRAAVAAVHDLLVQAKGSDSRVRNAAFRALGILAPEHHMPDLIGLLSGLPDDTTRKAAERMVADAAKRCDPVAKQVQAVLNALEKAPSSGVRCSLMRVLGNIGDNRAVQVVGDSVTDKDPKVRDTAIRVLSDWPNAAALDRLLKLVKTVKDRTHKVLALRGSVRLLELDTRGPGEKTRAYTDLVAGLKTADERRLVLAGLGKSGDAGALSVIEPMLADPEVRAEAELAALGVGRRAISAAPVAVKAMLARLAAGSRNEKTRKQAAAIVQLADQLKGYVAAWRVSGPYMGDVALPPPGPKSKPWKAIPIAPNNKAPWMMDLAGALGGGENRLCFVRTSIHCAEKQPARLDFGTDDANETWLNGKSIFSFAEGGAAIPGEHKVPVTLNKGWNTLMLKVTQISGPWQFCLRIVDAKGNPLSALRYDPARKPPAEHRPVAAKSKPPAAAPKPEAVAATPQIPPPADDAPGWTPLFNGKDLAGWNKTGNGIFKVEDGCLVGTQTDGKGGDLWTQSAFTNFELRVTYRVKWPANSGFWFRHDGRKGYQYDVLKYKNPLAFSATLYCPGKLFITKNLDEALENRDGWNEAHVRANGEELTLWLNGKTTGHCRDDTLSKGTVGIQIHGGDGFKGMEMVIKRMDIRPL